MAGNSLAVGQQSLSHAHLPAHNLCEGREFIVGKGTKEGLQQDNGLAQACVQIELRDIHGSPIRNWIYRCATGQLIGGLKEISANIHDHLMQGANLMEELGTLC